MSVRLVDIARAAGYSVSTVSRALHSKSSKNKISETAIAKIRAVADQMGYTTNKLAQSLKSTKTYEIGVVVSDIMNPFFATLVKRISKELRSLGYTLLLCDVDENTDFEKESLYHLVEKRIDGLIIAPVGKKSEHFDEIQKANIPTVLVDRIVPDSPFDTVSVDNYKGSCMATEYLIKEGHMRIAFIQGLSGTVTNEKRLKGFEDTLKKYNLKVPEKYIVGDDFRSLNGYLQTKTLLKFNNPPTAIFTAGDLIALGCIQALIEENLEIPGDISLVTFDNPSYFALLSPPITVVAQPVKKMAESAVKLLIDRIQNDTTEHKQIQFEPEFVIRKSVKRMSYKLFREKSKKRSNV
jgi:DNA-binding LacI/PurR family transcriptional regulator